MDYIANYRSESEDENEQVKTLRKLKSYTTEFKLKVVKHAQEFSDNNASKKFVWFCFLAKFLPAPSAPTDRNISAHALLNAHVLISAHAGG